MKSASVSKSNQPYLFLCVELLFIVFSIHIKNLERGLFTLRNIAILLSLLMLLIYGFSFKKTNKNDRIWVITMLLFGLYSLFLCFFNSNPLYDSHSSFRSIINFIIMVVIFPLFFCKLEKNPRRICSAIILVSFVQSSIVILSFLSPAFKNYLYEIQSFDKDWLIYRTVGLGIAGAVGSVYLFCGVLLNCYYLIFYEKRIINYLALLVNVFAIILVGRTGFYMSVVVLVTSFIIELRGPQRKAFINLMEKLLVAIIVSVFLVFIISKGFKINDALLISSFNRLRELWAGDTIQEIAKMDIPKLTLLTLFFGTGAEKGVTFDGSVIWNDSGYIQRYMGLGLIPAIISYLILACYLVSLNKKIGHPKKRAFWYVAIILMFIIEYKESFIFALALPFVLIVLLKTEISEGSNTECLCNY